MGIQVNDNQIRDAQVRSPHVNDLREQPLVTNLEQLKIPDVALQKQDVIQFLKDQSTRLQSIEFPSDFRSLEADFPEPQQGGISTVSNVTRDEMAALQSISQTAYDNINLHSQDFDSDSLLNAIDRLADADRSFPDVNRGEGSSNVAANGPDVLDQMFQEQYRETAEERKKLEEALAMAKNPESLNLILGYRYANRVQKRIGKIVEVYSQHVDNLDAIQSELNRNSRTGQAPNQAEILRSSSSLNRASTDISVIMNFMQKSLSDLEGVYSYMKRNDETINKSKDVGNQNFKS